MLKALLAAQPELLSHATAFASAELHTVSADDVASRVALSPRRLGAEDVWNFPGVQPNGSYVDQTEAAWDVLDRALTPFFADLERRFALGRGAESVAISQGILLGLKRASQRALDAEFLDGFALDCLASAAARVGERWRKGGWKARPGELSREQAREDMRKFVMGSLPEWRANLLRYLRPASRGSQRRARVR